jgi:hypothetical protein
MMKRKAMTVAGVAFIAGVAGAIIALEVSPWTAHPRQHSSAVKTSNGMTPIVPIAYGDSVVVTSEGQPPSGPQPFAFVRSQRTSDDLPTSMAETLGLDGASRKVATWADPHSGRAFVARSSSGKTCIVIVRDDESGGAGCNPTADPFQGKPFLWTSATEGGPAPADMTRLEFAGVARPDVARIELRDSAGDIHVLTLNPDEGFAFEEPTEALHAGVVPAEILAYSSDGKLLGSEDVLGTTATQAVSPH